MLRTTNNEPLSIQATGNKKNQDAPASAGAGGSAGGGGSIKNLTTAAKSTKSKKPNFAKANSGTEFLTSGAKEVFIHLQKAFTKALILRHFDLKCHIRIETDVSGYVISEVLSQMILDQRFSDHITHENLNPIFSKCEMGQWHRVAFFSRKMIPVETCYKTHDKELLAIVIPFKIWRHYLEGCKYEVLVFTDHNNINWFINIKSLSSR